MKRGAFCPQESMAEASIAVDLLGFLVFMIIRLQSLCIITLFLLLHISTVVSQSIVETLPGYPGPLPFKLETGYVGVGEDDEVQLFYYFIESERDPVGDPLVLWITGGPGCSGFSGLVYEVGPLKYDPETPKGHLPFLTLNPYSWTKVSSIIFLDSPAPTGFSYATTSEAYYSSDTKVVDEVYVFLQKWLLKHPNFIKNRLYIAGDSYGALWIPMIVSKISEGNEAGDYPQMALEGYCIGNPKTDGYIDDNSHVPFAHRVGLISDEYYQMAKINCKGNYVNPNPENSLCQYALQHYKECVRKIYVYHILEPTCNYTLLRQEELGFAQEFGDDKSMAIRLPSEPQQLCTRERIYLFCRIWANDPTVQEALHVQKGTVQEWKRCLGFPNIYFDMNVPSVIKFHQLLSNKGYRVLVFSGDHDFSIPYIGTIEWIRKLNLTTDDDWRPWFVEDEVAGYTERFINTDNSRYRLTFATVKGGGHTAAEYKRKECLAMFKRFLMNAPL